VSEDLELQLREDRALRNAALALVRADLAHVRADLSARGVGSRIVDRIGEGAVDVFEEAVEVADNHRGALATLVAAIILWFARHPLMSLFTDEDPAGAEEAEQQAHEGR
jgi:hypothetical protein